MRIVPCPSAAGSSEVGGLTAVFCRYDTGPILAQAVVPVYPTDSPKQLAARVLKEVCYRFHGTCAMLEKHLWQ